MLEHKGGSDHHPCQHSGLCRDIPDMCHHPCSLSHDTEGSCQSPARSCKPRRRVEVSPVPPVCPPPVKIHRRPLQQHRPSEPRPEPQPSGKPRRRVEQLPEQHEEPPVVLQPLRHRRPCIQRPPNLPRCPPNLPRCPPPAQRCRPAAVPLPPPPGQQQQRRVTLVA